MPNEGAMTRRARLFFVMGASGVGKDSLLAYARQRLAADLGIVFAHRYITRPADAGGENHIALGRAEFEQRRRLGCFALDWQAHGCHYGIGREIELWLGLGIDVVVNGSRGYFPTAAGRYPDIVGVHIDASPEILRQRLCARGRESGGEVEARLRRGAPLPADLSGLITLRNEGPLAEAGERLVRLFAARCLPPTTDA